MSTETTLEEAKDQVAEILSSLKNSNKSAILSTIEQAYPPSVDTGKADLRKKSFLWLFGLILISIPVIAGFITANIPAIPKNEIIEMRYLYTFIAFVAALASYLAGTSREIVKNLKGISPENYKALKWNIFYITAAEASLLLFGVLVIVRLFIGGFILLHIPSDSFILAYLLTNLFYLFGLHVRIWIITSPWNI